MLALTLLNAGLIAQIPVEVMLGHRQAGLDLMFFKFFKNKEEKPSKALFFNRSIATIDYRMTDTTYLPQFSQTAAISYNLEKLKGFAPVVIGQISNKGLFPKAGIQFARVQKRMVIFAWAVSELQKEPGLDLYFLLRLMPQISTHLDFFFQLENLCVFSTSEFLQSRYIQRLRLGLGLADWQFGLAGNFGEYPGLALPFTSNLGIFLRHEF